MDDNSFEAVAEKQEQSAQSEEYRMMMRGGAAVLSLLALSSLAQANLFTNGDFESVDGTLNITTGFQGSAFSESPVTRPLNQLAALGLPGVYDSIPGWQTVAGSGIEVHVQQVLGVLPHSGLHYLELDSHPRNGLSSASAMAQTVTLNGLRYQFTIAAEGPYAGGSVGGLIDDVSLVQTGPRTYRFSLFYLPRTTLLGQNGIAVYVKGLFGNPGAGFGTRLLYCNGANDAFLHDTASHRGIAAQGSATWTECSVEFEAVPEPATYALVGAGLVALFFIRRRRS
jgi:hypothetical protein